MNNYLITGSIGNISKPIIEGLTKSGHKVKVITSSEGRVKDIESLGAEACVGQLQDSAFVKSAFKGVDAAYTMIPRSGKLKTIEPLKMRSRKTTLMRSRRTTFVI